MNNPIYVPKGRAGEYGDYALNIYTGCPHRCYYCFAPSVLHKDRETFHTDVRPRDGIVEAVRKQLAGGGIRDKLIHLCFTCDPYPRGYDTTATRQIIEAIKGSGNHVQILTKNASDAERDFDLLDAKDWFGVTITGGWTTKDYEPNAQPVYGRYFCLAEAHLKGIRTWISCEPVLVPEAILEMLSCDTVADKIKIGKLNYHPSTIDWGAFGREAEAICKARGLDYYIKADLRAEMEKANHG